jgi:hypothetical protein
MIRELKTFEWTCDCCKRTVTTHAMAQYDSKPPGWINTYSSCGDWQCRGDHQNDYCDVCVNTAQKGHKRTEDNHWGIILRHLKHK